MKPYIPIAILIILLSSCTKPDPEPVVLETVMSPANIAVEWHIVFADEFNYTGAPNPDNWIYESGFVRNDEAQFYTSRPINIRAEGGNLIIEAHKETFEAAHYTSASILTRGKKSFRYGRIEMRAKLPSGFGVWPAFWTTGSNQPYIGWPACGEIDIMEYVGKSPNLSHSAIHVLGSSATGKSVIDPNVFHTYAIEWTEAEIRFYVDGINHMTHKIESESLRKPHELRLNFALGGSWGGEIDDSIFPQQYIVDYVRYYADKPEINFITPIISLLLN